MFNLNQEIDWRVTPFVAVAVVVAIFVLAWTAGAEEVTFVTVRGQEYFLTPGQSVVQPIEVSDGLLAVRQVGGDVVYISSRQKLANQPAPSAKYETRYKPNGQPYRVLVQSQATETDIALAEHDLRVMQDDREFQLEATRLQQEIKNDQHDNHVDWSEEARDWQRDRERAKEREARAEAQAKRDKQRARESQRRDVQRTLERSADRAQDSVRRGLDRLERWSQN